MILWIINNINKLKNKRLPTNLIIDIDGVMTNGQMVYSKNKKEFKIFGPDDSDAIKILKKFINIIFISADKRGFAITKRRIKFDMNMRLYLVDGRKRKSILQKRYDLSRSIFIGDGIFDHLVMQSCFYSITVKDALDHVKKNADYVIKRAGANRAVAEASIHILKKFFKKSFEKITNE